MNRIAGGGAIACLFLFGAMEASAATFLDTTNGDAFDGSGSGHQILDTLGIKQSIAVRFSSPTAAAITNVTAYIGDSAGGSIDFGIMADSNGVPSGTFLSGAHQIVSLSIVNPVTLTSLNWTISGATTYWLAAIATPGTSAGWENGGVNGLTGTFASSGGGPWQNTSADTLPQAIISGDAIPAVPLPAALPLFATGLGVLGLLGWRRKRSAAVA